MPEFILELEIDYNSGSKTTRRISVSRYSFIQQDTAVVIHAYCWLRHSERSFNSINISRCVNLADSNEIPDLVRYIKSIEDSRSVGLNRNQQKYELLKGFRLEILYYHFKRQFFFLFDDQCFKCGKQADWYSVPEADLKYGGMMFQRQLVIDHHIPIEKGGSLESGNLVSLCRRCNGVKGAKHPHTFYTDDELQRLKHYLIVQDGLFPKNKIYWSNHEWNHFLQSTNNVRAAMLLKEGVDEVLIRCCLRSKEHSLFCGMSSS